MNTLYKNFKLSASKINGYNIRLIWFLITLTLLIIGTGAPEGGNGWGGG